MKIDKNQIGLTIGTGGIILFLIAMVVSMAMFGSVKIQELSCVESPGQAKCQPTDDK